MCFWEIKLIKKEKFCRLLSFCERLGILFLCPVPKCSIYHYHGLNISMLQLILVLLSECLHDSRKGTASCGAEAFSV